MSTLEEIRENVRRGASGDCPECGGPAIRTDYLPANRTEPGFEIWQCKDQDGCGYEWEW